MIRRRWRSPMCVIKIAIAASVTPLSGDLWRCHPDLNRGMAVCRFPHGLSGAARVYLGLDCGIAFEL
jgi:hypothetical protein